MISRINKTRKSFITAVGMSLVLLMASAFGILIDTKVGQLLPDVTTDSWSNYKTTPTGSGTEASPYKIGTPGELAYLINLIDDSFIYAELTSDIDLLLHEWEPIRIKAMNFPVRPGININGNNHIISNMTINKPSEEYAGFIGGDPSNMPNIEVLNLNFANVNVVGKNYVGAVVGVISNAGKFENVNVLSGQVVSTNKTEVQVGNMTLCNTGGICGYGGTYKNCTNNATVNGGSDVGGIVGYYGIIENCINTGDVIGLTCVGGLCGFSGTVKNSYAECSVTGTKQVYGIGYSTNSTNSGFYGDLYVNSDNPEQVGTIGGTATNCFGVANVYFNKTDSLSTLLPFGVSGSSVKSSYSYANVYTTAGRSEVRRLKYDATETTPFSEFVYNKNINNGYPFPKNIFAVGQFIDCNTKSYLEENKFIDLPYVFVKKGDHWYFEMGLYPQTYVGDSLNSTLKSWYTSSFSVDEFTNDTGTSGTVTYNAYKYTDGNTYVRVPSAQVNSSGYKFQNSTSVVSGSEYWFKVEPIKWWVLNYDAVMNDNANPVILAEQALTANVTWNKTYVSGEDYNLWYNSERCNIRTWLNGQFYNDAFDTAAKGNIHTTTVGNNNQSSYDDTAGTATQDKVWLLSNNEANGGYLKIKSERLCSPTDYALANKCYLYTSTSYPTEIRKNGGTCNFWLRSAYTSYAGSVRCVSPDGNLASSSVNVTSYAVRPALTLAR